MDEIDEYIPSQNQESPGQYLFNKGTYLCVLRNLEKICFMPYANNNAQVSLVL